jgi:hypothetical protein
VAFAIVAAVAFAPSRAQATCGDYVHIGPPPQAADVGSPGETTPTPDAPRQPCHGPGCSGHPGPPTVPLSAPVSFESQAKQWAARVHGEGDSGGPPGRSLADPSDCSPVHMSRSIFHPPRV